MSDPRFPLRQKRKAATRRSLVQSAERLFAEQGYDETTLEQVAEQAGLHVQTLYRHFPNKLELATAGARDRLENFREAITDPDRADSTFVFWRNWVQVSADKALSGGGQLYRDFLLQRWGRSVVSTQIVRIGHAYEDLLTESLSRDFNLPAESIGTPRLVAIMLWGVNGHVQRLYAQHEDFDFAREAVAVVDEVEELFGHLVQN